MDPHLSALQATPNGVAKILRETATQSKPSEFIAQVRYGLGTIELYFGTPEGTSMSAATGRYLRGYVRVVLAQMEFVVEAYASATDAKLSDDELTEIADLIERAEEIEDSLGWVVDEPSNSLARRLAASAST